MDKNIVKAELERTSNLVIETAKSIPAQQWKAQPGPDSWSAAQILEHIVITEGLIIKVLPRKGRVCTDRQPDAQVAVIRDLLTNDEKKLVAHGPIVPGPESKLLDEQLARFTQQRQAFINIADQHNLDELVNLVKHPILGALTRGEWMWFYILHGERHARQMQRLL